MLTARGIKILASRSGETVELLCIVVLVTHYHSPCLRCEYDCPCRTLLFSLSTVQISLLQMSHAIALLVYRMYMSALVSLLLLSLSTAQIRLSLSHATAFLVYSAYMSVLLARCCSLCLARVYVLLVAR